MELARRSQSSRGGSEAGSARLISPAGASGGRPRLPSPIHRMRTRTSFHDPMTPNRQGPDLGPQTARSRSESPDRNPDQPYCRLVIAPKLQRLRAKYAARPKVGA